MLVVVRMNCAGFDSFSTEIRLTDAKATLSRGRDQVIASLNGTRIVQVTWIDETSVVLFAPDGVAFTIHKAELEGVRFQFR
jgi:hypothetical protein